MKNSKEYTRQIRKLYRALKQQHPKIESLTYDEPAEAVVYAILSENMGEAAAQSASKRFTSYFVDLNDLRVSRPEEVMEILGQDTPVTRDIVATLARVLLAIFNQYNTVSLQALKKIGKRPAKQVLEKLDGTSHFVVNYCMLTSLQAHAIPLTTNMIEYLRSNELVDAGADQQEIEGFLTRQISAKNAYEFYALLRRESESRKAKPKTTVTGQAKTKTGTTARKKK
jgi:endonuclease III